MSSIVRVTELFIPTAATPATRSVVLLTRPVCPCVDSIAVESFAVECFLQRVSSRLPVEVQTVVETQAVVEIQAVVLLGPVCYS